jgi:hypothetical protein
MQTMEPTILLEVIIMVTNPLPRIFTIPITLIRMATTTIPILKDMRNRKNTGALSTREGAGISKAAVNPATADPATADPALGDPALGDPAMGAGAEVRRWAGPQN